MCPGSRRRRHIVERYAGRLAELESQRRAAVYGLHQQLTMAGQGGGGTANVHGVSGCGLDKGGVPSQHAERVGVGFAGLVRSGCTPSTGWIRGARPPTTWTVLQQDGPNHLGLW